MGKGVGKEMKRKNIPRGNKINVRDYTREIAERKESALRISGSAAMTTTATAICITLRFFKKKVDINWTRNNNNGGGRTLEPHQHTGKRRKIPPGGTGGGERHREEKKSTTEDS